MEQINRKDTFKKMIDFNRIGKECFWDLLITEKQINDIVIHGSSSEKAFLFEKILLNSTRLFEDLRIFPNDELKYLIENYRVPEFNNEFVFRRKNLAEVYFLRKPLLIEELKWIA
ncbi:MAG TPA: hypothetical protein DD381_10220 [Lentisphaeria bacterium]|nr:MAG: hypothetical protein A2X47_11995 [Lentisphaerae bacterium GWF2_38_69]HBM16700.1 hypothetical protein [Lentisphaeria bacterium]